MRAKAAEAKISRGDQSNRNSFCSAKETASTGETQPTKWKRVFANHISDKGFISKSHEELLHLDSK